MKIKLLCLLTLMLGLGCGNKENTLMPLELGSFAEKPKTITIRIKNYNSQPGKSFQNLFVSNFSIKAEAGQLHLSSARDGMTDALKNQLAISNGFTSQSSESALPGFADLFLFRAGIVSSQYYLLYCSGNQAQSSSFEAFVYNDTRPGGSPSEFLGLRDCVKSYMGLNPALFDYDTDGIPDYLEVRAGLNPADKSDAYLSTAGDGVPNIEKVKRNIPIDENAESQPNQVFSYKYETQVNPDGSRDFIISNIPVMNDGVDNFIAFYMTEFDISNKSTSLYTAFMAPKRNIGNQTLEMDYWATDATRFYNQEIVLP